MEMLCNKCVLNESLHASYCQTRFENVLDKKFLNPKFVGPKSIVILRIKLKVVTSKQLNIISEGYVSLSYSVSFSEERDKKKTSKIWTYVQIIGG